MFFSLALISDKQEVGGLTQPNGMMGSIVLCALSTL